MTPVRPVVVCASGRLALDDVLGNKLTVIGLATGRLARGEAQPAAMLAMIAAAVADLEEALRGLTSCRACPGCARGDPA